MPRRWISRSVGIIIPRQGLRQIYRATGVGLGDVVHAVFWCLGIDWVWKKAAQKLRRPCGCQRRQMFLNQIRFYSPIRWVTNKDPRTELVADGGGSPVRPEDLPGIAKAMDPS